MSVNATKRIKDYTHVRNTKRAFYNGFYQRIKKKRHYHQKYDLYHYYLPSQLSPIIKFLKEYFKLLDQVCDTPLEHRYRQTEFEFVEIAAKIFHYIRIRSSNCNPIVAGSVVMNPVPWAIFGPNINRRIARHTFPSPVDILKHYGPIIYQRGCNAYRVSRPLNLQPDNDPLIALADVYNQSVNYMLSICILLMFDLVVNGGPDSGEFMCLYLNDKRSENKNNYYWEWRAVRDLLSPPDPLNISSMWSHNARPQTQQLFYPPHTPSYYTAPSSCTPRLITFDKCYFDVSIYDHIDEKNHSAENLCDGENVTLFNINSPIKTPQPDSIENLSLSDFDNNNEIDDISKLDQQYRRMFSNTYLDDTDFICCD